MFRKLKEKISEEVKPFKLTQFTQSTATHGSKTSHTVPSDENCTVRDEIPEEYMGNDGFSVVDLQSPTLSPPLASGRFSRQSSMSSLASDASSFFPIQDASFGTFNVQPDSDLASEREDVTPQINNLSKEELSTAYIKLYRHYQKYKGRAADLKLFCRELEKDNRKHKTILLECQEKSLRRMAELKEQCALEQRAKAHLEEALRNDLEEKDHLIKTLLTKIQLLKETTAAHLCVEENDKPADLVDMRNDQEISNDILLQSHQGPRTAHGYNKEEEFSHEMSDQKQLIGKIDKLRCNLNDDTYLDKKDPQIKAELRDVLSEISEALLSSTSTFDEQNSCKLEDNPSNHIENKDNTFDIVAITSSKSVDSSCNLQPDKVPLSCEYVEPQLEKTGDISAEYELLKLEADRLANELQSTKQLIEKKERIILELTEKCVDIENRLEETLNDKKCALEKISSDKCALEEYKVQISNLKEDLCLKETELQQIVLDMSAIKSAEVSEELKAIQSENLKLTEMVTNMQNDAMNTKLLICQIIQEVQTSNETILKQEPTDLSEGNVPNLVDSATQQEESDFRVQVENKSFNFLCENIQKEFSSLLCLIKERNSKITKANDNITILSQRLEEVQCRNVELNKLVSSLQSELADIQKCKEELTEMQRLLNMKNSTIDELTKDVNTLDADLKKTIYEKAQVCETITTLDNKLKLSELQFEQMSKDLQSSYKLVEEKDSTILSISEDLTDLHKELDTVSFQKAETNEVVETLQNELSTLNDQLEQVNLELQSTNKLIEEKDSTISSISEDFSKICKELEVVSYQKSEIHEKVVSLQNELCECKSHFQRVNVDHQVTCKQIAEKDCFIEELTRKVSSIENDFKSSLSQNVEIYEQINVLQDEITTGKQEIKSLIQKLESAHELISGKQLLITSQRESITSLQTEFDVTTLENDKLNNIVGTLKNKLTELNLQFEFTSKDLVIAQQENCEKDSEIVALTENLASMREQTQKTLAEKTNDNATINALQDEFQNLNSKMKQLSEEYVSSQALVKEKEITIKRLNQELISLQNRLETLETISNKQRNSLPVELMNEKYNDEKQNTDLQTTHLLIDKISSNAVSTAGNFVEGNKEEEKRLLQEVPNKIILTPENKVREELSTQECVRNYEREEECVKEQIILQFNDVEKVDPEGNNSSSLCIETKENINYNNVNNLNSPFLCDTSESRNGENIANITIPPTQNMSCEGSMNYSGSKEKFPTPNERSVLHAVPNVDEKERHHLAQDLQLEHEDAEFDEQRRLCEVPSFKNVLDEIQKQSKESGILLEQYKNIIRHLEDIANFFNTIENDNSNWLREQLMSLNQMYFNTLEKQNLQSANISKLLQDVTTQPPNTDNNQTIEMQYLRNIVFQYMIGKETMLLAKVISAIMKFDQKQMDQVMQKEQQKQTVFGQLGLL